MKYDVFTTIKVKDSRPLFFDAHYKRLFTHAEKLGITRPPLTDRDVKKYIRSQNLINCALKITLSNDTGLQFAVRPLPVPAKDPISLITVPDTRDGMRVYKTTDRGVCMQAKTHADGLGAGDALFVTEGNIIESTMCNVFSINDRGQLITPDVEGLGLAGITRQVIMNHFPVLIKQLPASTSDPMVLVNSLRVTPVNRLDGRQLQDGSRLLDILRKVVQDAEQE
jgi:branched-subunit amino acid aminotransferase/4-amino-4-deoxychorismate lyase